MSNFDKKESYFDQEVTISRPLNLLKNSVIAFFAGGLLCQIAFGSPQTQLKEKLLENAKPITQKVVMKNITAKGDTLLNERIDTVAYQIEAKKFELK